MCEVTKGLAVSGIQLLQPIYICRNVLKSTDVQSNLIALAYFNFIYGDIPRDISLCIFPLHLWIVETFWHLSNNSINTVEPL